MGLVKSLLPQFLSEARASRTVGALERQSNCTVGETLSFRQLSPVLTVCRHQ